MKTVVIGPPPPELQQLIQRRRSLGLDRFDEVWEGNLHLAPVPGFGHAYIEREVARVLRPFADAAGLIETGPFNLGRASDFRVPDGGYHRSVPEGDGVYVTRAALVVEVVSTDDETFEKFPFYACLLYTSLLVMGQAPSSHHGPSAAHDAGDPFDGQVNVAQ